MLGQRFLQTSYQKKLTSMDFNVHMKKLDEIKKSPTKKKEVTNDSKEGHRETISSQGLKFQRSEKIVAIDKDNRVLLDKLVSISRNKRTPLVKTTGFDNHPGTLNSPYRKKELERIANENEAMAKRLISQKGSFNRKKLDVEFEKHQDMVKKVQKMSSPKLEKLPPLSSPKASDDSTKLKKKKNNRKQKSEGAEQAIKEATERLEQEAPKETAEPAKGSSGTDAQTTEPKSEEKIAKVESKEAVDASKDDVSAKAESLPKPNREGNSSVEEIKNKTETQNTGRNNNDSKAENKSLEKLNEKTEGNQTEQKTITVQDEKAATPVAENTENKEANAQQPVEEKAN